MEAVGKQNQSQWVFVGFAHSVVRLCIVLWGYSRHWWLFIRSFMMVIHSLITFFTQLMWSINRAGLGYKIFPYWLASWSFSYALLIIQQPVILLIDQNLMHWISSLQYDQEALVRLLLSRLVFVDPDYRVNKKGIDFGQMSINRNLLPSTVFPTTSCMLNWHNASLSTIANDWLLSACLQLNQRLRTSRFAFLRANNWSLWRQFQNLALVTFYSPLLCFMNPCASSACSCL